jgi:uncharacterized protein (DUF2342 family)
MSTFNLVWTSPATLPTKAEFNDPIKWLERVGGASGRQLNPGVA